jgi:quinol monooxygenase YgiN
MDNVVLINPFEVPERTDDEFLRWWDRAAEFMRAQSGFVSTRLHRAVLPDARFRFINVAEWKSIGDWQAAMSSPTMQEVVRDSAVTAFPSLYEVVRVH